jgi:hypothetical protein
MSDADAQQLAAELGRRIVAQRVAVRLIARGIAGDIVKRDADAVAAKLLQLADVLGYNVAVRR